MQKLFRSPAHTAFLSELKPRSLPASLITGVIMAFMEIFFALSFASLIFHGSLAANLPQGILRKDEYGLWILRG